MLSPADDHGHDIGTDPRARESLLWNLLLPDDDIYLIAYVNRNADMLATPLIVGYDTQSSTPNLLEIVQDIAMSSEDHANFSAGPISVKQSELMNADITFKTDKIKLELNYRATHEAFAFGSHPEGCPPVAGTNRFEQSGLISGKVDVYGKSVEFNTTGHRDHSWGIRNYAGILHYKWYSAQAGADVSFHCFELWWRDKRYINGYVWRDGELAALKDFDVSLQYDKDMLARSGQLTMTDYLGRVTRASGERFAGGFMPLGETVLSESGCRFEIEGKPGVGVFECTWQPEYLAHLRQYPNG